MPFRRFEDMNAFRHAKELGMVQFYKALYKQLEPADFEQIRVWSDEALKRYFGDE